MSDPNAARNLLRRSKESERVAGRWFIEHDGPDPAFMPGNGVVTKTGRVGHVNALQYDVHSRHYAVENKHIRLNATWLLWWVKIVSRAMDLRKEPCLRIDPSNKPDSFMHNGFRHKIPEMHVITASRHAWLLECERVVEALDARQV